MLQVSDISFAYGSLVALDGVSFGVEPGEGVALLGPNGAGKSTLMQVLMGALTPSRGEALLDGAPLGAGNRRALGYVPQDIALQKDLTSQENLEILAACAGLGGEELATAVAAGLALAGMEERAGDRVDTLSGGMKRRINLAAGLVHGPRLLLLDEPTAGVDPVESARIMGALAGWKGEGGSFLISTHRMEEAEGLCDRVVFIHHGQVLEAGTVAEVLSRCEVREAIHVVFSGEAPGVPEGWPESLPVEHREDRWVVAAGGSQGLAKVAEMAGGVSGLVGLEPHRPDLGVRFRELAGEGLS